MPLGQVRTLLDLIPCFRANFNKQLTKETSLELGLKFWLNKYFEKELFYALNNLYIFQIATNFTFQVPYTHNIGLIILLAKTFLTLFLV